MNPWLASLLILLGVAAYIGLVIWAADRGWKWQARRQNEERQTDTPITGVTQVSIPASTERFEAIYRRAIELNADKPGRRKVSNMELTAVPITIRNYQVEMDADELNALRTIVRKWLENHNGMPGYQDKEVPTAKTFLMVTDPNVRDRV